MSIVREKGVIVRFNKHDGVDILSLEDKHKTTVESRNLQPAILQVFRRGPQFKYVLFRRNPNDPRQIDGVLPDYTKWPDRRFLGTVEGIEKGVLKIKPDDGNAPHVYSKKLCPGWLWYYGFLRDNYPPCWVSFEYQKFGNEVLHVLPNYTNMVPRRFSGHCSQLHDDGSVSIVADGPLTTPLRSSPITNKAVLNDLNGNSKWRKISFLFHSATDFSYGRINIYDVRTVN